MKINFITKLISAVCVAVMATSCVAMPVGATDEVEINQIMVEIDKCEISIQDLNKQTTEIINITEAEITALNEEIKEKEGELRYILDLIVKRDNHEEDCNRLMNDIENIKRQIEEINSKLQKDLQEIENRLQQLNAQKGNMEAQLKKLLNELNSNNMPQNNLTKKEQDSVNLWKNISSGSQYDPSEKIMYKCWLMSSMNQLNFFNKINKINDNLPVRSLQEAISFYKNTGGDLQFLANQLQDSSSITNYLNSMGIRTLNLSYDVKVNYPADGNARANEVAEKKTVENFTKIFTEQMKSHFKNQNVSPVSICMDGHWVTIVNYFDDTKNVVIVDSLSGGANSIVEAKNIEKFISDNVKSETWHKFANDPKRCFKETHYRFEMVFTTQKNLGDNYDKNLAICNDNISKNDYIFGVNCFLENFN